MPDLDLSYTPASELARMVRAKEISPVEIVQNSLDRIEQVNPELNCFCFTYPEEALKKARDAEHAIMAGDDIGPLMGIPIAIKDFTPTKGKTTTRGSHLLKDWVPDWDAVLVQRLETAGAIMVGKTATPEFATSGFTNTPLWGVTRNPWDTTRTSGGSSGGSGAAVASGCVPMAEGTDMGGSVRIPAGLCGIVGLKPSLGRIPMDIIDTVFDNISHFGPLTRTINDATTFLDITQGQHACDIQSIPRCNLDSPATGDIRGMKIALSIDLGFFAVDPGIEANLRNTADALRDAGATVEEVSLDWDNSLVHDWDGAWAVFMAAAYARLTDVDIEENAHQLSDGFAHLVRKGQKISAVTARGWDFNRTRAWQKLAAIHETYDALLCPTMAVLAPSADLGDNDFGGVDENGRTLGMDMTSVFNFVAQCPALSVPSGFSNGLPTAAQIVTRKWDDATALRIGAAIENALPWARKRPNI